MLAPQWQNGNYSILSYICYCHKLLNGKHFGIHKPFKYAAYQCNNRMELCCRIQFAFLSYIFPFIFILFFVFLRSHFCWTCILLNVRNLKIQIWNEPKRKKRKRGRNKIRTLFWRRMTLGKIYKTEFQSDTKRPNGNADIAIVSNADN